MKKRWIILLFIVVVLTSCQKIQKTDLNYCSEDADCEIYWMGFDSGICPNCDIEDERWICANEHEMSKHMLQLNIQHRLPQHCGQCSLDMSGYDCKCSRGVCIKK